MKTLRFVAYGVTIAALGFNLYVLRETMKLGEQIDTFADEVHAYRDRVDAYAE